MAVCQFIAVTLIDLDYHSVFVGMADTVLLLRMDPRVSLVFGVCAVLWIVLITSESVFRFGLLDVPLTHSQDHRRKLANSMISCDTLPCPMPLTSLSTSEQLESMMVFIVDFVSTRYFATQVEKEQASMEATIIAVKDIAMHLAAYDVQAVDVLLTECESTIPSDVHAALRSVEQNLRRYRPYLPKTCLPQATSVQGQSSERSDLSPGETNSMSSSSSRTSLFVPEETYLSQLLTKRVTTLLINITNTLGQLKEDMPAFCSLFASVLTHALEATEHSHGMVDMFVGDKVMCSFNSSRRCLGDACAAVATAKPHAPHCWGCGKHGCCAGQGALRRHGVLRHAALRTGGTSVYRGCRSGTCRCITGPVNGVELHCPEAGKQLAPDATRAARHTAVEGCAARPRWVTLLC